MSLAQDKKLRPILISLVLGVFILGLKFWAYFLTDSLALKSDAFESIVNVLASSVALFSLIYSLKPADKNHPFGHGKMEFFSATFEGGMVLIAGILIVYEGIKGFIRPHEIHELSLGLFINIMGGLLNGALSVYLIKEGKKQKSQLLLAEGLHIRSDFITTIGIVVSLLLVQYTPWKWLDPAFAVLVGLHLIYASFEVLKNSSSGLLDEEDPELNSKINDSLNRVHPPEIIDVHSLRTIRTGRTLHIQMHVDMPEFMDIKKCHEIMTRFEFGLAKDLKSDGEFHTHIDPCQRKHCIHCEVNPCPIRREPFLHRPKFKVEEITTLGDSHHFNTRERNSRKDE